MAETELTGAETAPVTENASAPAKSAAVIRGERAIERALERAAVRELQTVRRDEYAAQDADERKFVERLRHERNEADDARRAQEWQMAVDRELAGAQRRNPWVEAHAATAEAKRAAKLAQREAAAAMRDAEAKRMAEIRKERIAYEDELSAKRLREGGEAAMAMAGRHAAWTDAIQAVSDLKKASRAKALERRAARKKERASAQAEEDQARHLRNLADDERGMAIRKAARDRAMATIDRWEAEKSGDPDRIERAVAEERRLRDEEARLRANARHDHNAAEDEWIARSWRKAKERAVSEAEQNEEYIEARYRMAVERRRALDEDREIRLRERPARQEADAALRKERNARQSAWRGEIDRMNLRREFALSDLRQDWLDAKDAERETWKRIKAEDKAAMSADLAREAEAKAANRHERNLAEDERQKLIWDTYKKREYARAVDREIARENARAAYRDMERVATPAE